MSVPDSDRVSIIAIHPGDHFRLDPDGPVYVGVEPPDGRPRPWVKRLPSGMPEIWDAALLRVIPCSAPEVA